MHYIEYALGDVKNRNKIVHLNDFPNIVQIARKTEQPLFMSHFRFGIDLMEHWEARKTVSGFPGKIDIPYIILDIDKGEKDDKQVYLTAQAFLMKLQDENIADIDINCYYSGTGYHFVVPNMWKFETHTEVQATIAKHYPECDNGIYTKTALIRVGNTINRKTNRWKIPLLNSELYNLDHNAIIELSQNIRTNITFPAFECGTDLSSQKIHSKPLSNTPQIVKEDGMTNMITCAQKMFNTVPVKGQRHHMMFRMVSAFKRSGLPENAVLALMIKWIDGGMPVGEVTKSVADIYRNTYLYGCADKLMSEYCDERCAMFKKKNYGQNEPKEFEELEKMFMQSILDKTEFHIPLQQFFGIPRPFSIFPEEYVTIIGDTGLGKSALIQNILVGSEHRSLYLNFEVGERLMFRRFVQIAYLMTKDEVVDYYTNTVAMQSLTSRVKHISMLSNRITVPELETLIAIHGFRIVVADTLECFNTPGIIDITQKTEFLAHELKRIAKKYKIIVIAVHHISKSSILDKDGNTKKLTSHAGKGSSAVEQEADKVIIIEGEQNNGVRTIRSGKARDESPFETTMNVDAEHTFVFSKGLWNPKSTAIVSSTSVFPTVQLR